MDKKDFDKVWSTIFKVGRQQIDNYAFKLDKLNKRQPEEEKKSKKRKSPDDDEEEAKAKAGAGPRGGQGNLGSQEKKVTWTDLYRRGERPIRPEEFVSITKTLEEITQRRLLALCQELHGASKGKLPTHELVVPFMRFAQQVRAIVHANLLRRQSVDKDKDEDKDSGVQDD